MSYLHGTKSLKTQNKTKWTLDIKKALLTLVYGVPLEVNNVNQYVYIQGIVVRFRL